MLRRACKAIVRRRHGDAPPSSRLQTAADDVLAVNLSLACLTRLVLWMPFAVVSEVTESWFFGSVMCKVGHMARDVSGLVYGATMLAYIGSTKEIYKEFAVYEFRLLFSFSSCGFLQRY